MSVSSSKFFMLTASLAVLSMQSGQALAKKPKIPKKKIKIEKSMPKVKKFYGTDDYIPYEGSGAVLKVYGQNGQYDSIGNLTGVSKQPWKMEAICSLGQTLVKSWVESEGVTSVAYDLEALQKQLKKKKKRGQIGLRFIRGHGTKTVTTPINVTNLAAGINPVQACNGELAERAARTGKSRKYWQQHGFVIRMENAVTAQGRAQCVTELTPALLDVPAAFFRETIGKKKKHTLKASAKAPLYIACMPSNLHGKQAIPLDEAEKNKPKPRPGFAPKPKILPIGSVYAKKCPAQIRLGGEVFAQRPVTIRYRYRGTGWVGPTKSKQLSKGINTLPPQNIVLSNDRAGTGLNLSNKGAADRPDMQGQAWLEILQTKNNIVSKKTPYSVYCNKEPKRTPPKPKLKKVIIAPIPQNGQ